MIEKYKLAKKNFLSSLDMSYEEAIEVLELAEKIKNKDIKIKLEDKVLGLIFDKSLITFK